MGVWPNKGAEEEAVQLEEVVGVEPIIIINYYTIIIEEYND